jgi:dihydrofolate synthase/folylpolyglutamate synthase
MTYGETVAWMFRQLPMYQQQGATAYRKDLANTILLADRLGHPERGLKFIHVAGTNGKGSTSHMLASILQEAGFKTGLYTSPHLKDFRERIKIDGREIPEDFVVDFIAKHRLFFERQNLSFFEMSVGLAFDYFARENVAIAVIETGMGGRLDATNIITPVLSVITNIGMDHTQFLGERIEAIASEKAGIIKPQVPVVIGEYTQETRPVFIEKASACGAPVYFASDNISVTPGSDLKGVYQQSNKKTVLQAVDVLQKKGFAISGEAVLDGLQSVVKNTGLRGRWQQLGEKPLVVCDTAHNRPGFETVLKQINAVERDKLRMVLGFVNDKNLDDLLPLFPKDAVYYFCKPGVMRGMDAAATAAAARRNGLDGETYDSVRAAYEGALADAAAGDFIYVGGSTFVVAEIL